MSDLAYKICKRCSGVACVCVRVCMMGVGGGRSKWIKMHNNVHVVVMYTPLKSHGQLFSAGLKI